MAVLRAQQVVKRFGATAAVDGVDLDVGPGEIYCLLGANGAGKTTLVNLFLGFLVADAGVLAVDGTDPGRMPQQARLKLAYTCLRWRMHLHGSPTVLLVLQEQADCPQMCLMNAKRRLASIKQ
jgi:ABC-type multidrug transport system ATPase subunit